MVSYKLLIWVYDTYKCNSVSKDNKKTPRKTVWDIAAVKSDFNLYQSYRGLTLTHVNQRHISMSSGGRWPAGGGLVASSGFTIGMKSEAKAGVGAAGRESAPLPRGWAPRVAARWVAHYRSHACTQPRRTTTRSRRANKHNNQLAILYSVTG